MIKILLRVAPGKVHHVWLPGSPIPYQIDTAAWMGLRRIRVKHPEIGSIRALDVFLDGKPVATDDSERVIKESEQVTITLQPRELKRETSVAGKPEPQQFFLID